MDTRNGDGVGWRRERRNGVQERARRKMRVVQTPTLSGAGTPRDPLGALSSRTARRIGERPTNSDIDEEVDGGGCRAGEAGRNGWEARESAWGRDARAFEAGPHRVTNCVHDFRWDHSLQLNELKQAPVAQQVNRCQFFEKCRMIYFTRTF